MKPPHAELPRTSLRSKTLRTGLAALACLIAGSAAGATGASEADPSFAPGPSLPVGLTASADTVGDFDGNGSADLAVTNSGYKNNLRILLNDGAGHLHMAPGSPFKVGRYPSSVAAADFNHDGRPDLAVASENVRILLGDGSGRFSAAPGSPIAVPGNPYAFNAADVNGDGSADLAVVVFQNDRYRVRILLNDGSGLFVLLPAVPPVTGKGEVLSLGVAEFTGDGKPDLAVSGGATTKIVLLPGDGTGSFGPAQGISAGKNPGQLAVGDFNGEGKPDLAVLVRGGVAILLGNGAGGFRAAGGSPFRFGSYLNALAVADFNGDGKPDLAAADGYSGYVGVLLGKGAGRFRSAPLSPFFGRWPGSVVAADFDGNGRADLFPLSYGVSWGPYPRGNMVLFQTASMPRVLAGRSLPAKADAILSTRKPISTLAADGRQAAVCVSTYPGQLVVWTAPGRRSRRLAADCGSELAIAGGRVAWIEYYYGNTHRGYVVSVAKVSGGRPREVDSTLGEDIETEGSGDVGGPWVGQLIGGGPVLAYNSWWVDCIPPPCDEECRDEGGVGGCDEGNPTLRITAQGLERIGARRSFAIRVGPSSYPLSAVGGGRMAVDHGTGVLVLRANGSRVASIPALEADPPRALALSGRRLAVLRSFALDLYDAASGAKRKSIPLGRAAALQLGGVRARVALLRGPHRLLLVRLRDGKLVSFPLRPAAAKGLVDAKLTAAGLFYAYNLPRGAAKGRLVFEPASKLLARF